MKDNDSILNARFGNIYRALDRIGTSEFLKAVRGPTAVAAVAAISRLIERGQHLIRGKTREMGDPRFAWLEVNMLPARFLALCGEYANYEMNFERFGFFDWLRKEHGDEAAGMPGMEYAALDHMGTGVILDRLEGARNADEAEAFVMTLVTEGMKARSGNDISDSHFAWLERNVPFGKFIEYCRAYAEADIDRCENNFFDWLKNQRMDMSAKTDNPFRFPAHIEKRYGLNGTDFQDFLDIEAEEAGSLDPVERDMERLAEWAGTNKCVTHPWFTESQRDMLASYLDGEFAYILAIPERERAYERLRLDGDGMIRSFVAACDSVFSPSESREMFGRAFETLDNARENESENPKPGA